MEDRRGSRYTGEDGGEGGAPERLDERRSEKKEERWDGEEQEEEEWMEERKKREICGGGRREVHKESGVGGRPFRISVEGKIILVHQDIVRYW
jgi:hypothetical protein